MRKFYDVETEEIITEDDLRYEFEALKRIAAVDGGGPEAETFGEYLAACLDKNGTLTEIVTKKEA